MNEESATDMYNCTHGPKKDCHACLVGELVEALQKIHDWAALGAEWGDMFSVAVRDESSAAIAKAKLIQDCVPIEEAEEASRT